MPLQTHGVVAKAGVDALSACTAIEFGPRGITSNIIAPGPIADTEGVKRLSRVEGLESENLSRIPAGRMGSLKEIADATIFLFGDTGSYVNGATVVGKNDPVHSDSTAPHAHHDQWTEVHGEHRESATARFSRILGFSCPGRSMTRRNTQNCSGQVITESGRSIMHSIGFVLRRRDACTRGRTRLS
jgi:hypothetical protein